MSERLELLHKRLSVVAPGFRISDWLRIESIFLQHVGDVDGRLTWDVTLQLSGAESAVSLSLRESWIHSMPELACQSEPHLINLEIEDIHSWQRPPYRFRVFELAHDDNIQRGRLFEAYCREIDVLPVGL